jgi:hypothetical protein
LRCRSGDITDIGLAILRLREGTKLPVSSSSRLCVRLRVGPVNGVTLNVRARSNFEQLFMRFIRRAGVGVRSPSSRAPPPAPGSD